MRWPETPEELAREQERLRVLSPEPWTCPDRALRFGACAVVFGRGAREDRGFAAAVVEERNEVIAASVHVARTDMPFEPGRLALREGPILETVVRNLPRTPDVLLVAAAGRDHPHGAGLALHLGAALGMPTVGVTDEPLLAEGEDAETRWGSSAPLRIAGAVVAYRLRSRGGTKPIVAHAAWRTSPETAKDVALFGCSLARWPDAMREARRIARELRAGRPLRGPHA